MREEYGKLNRVEMSIWECCELLNSFVDESDPDIDEPQIEHLLQTAEAIRRDYPDEDWLHLTGLIHGMHYAPPTSISFINFLVLYLICFSPSFEYICTLNIWVLSDLGKVLLHPSFGALPQWAVVGENHVHLVQLCITEVEHLGIMWTS